MIYYVKTSFHYHVILFVWKSFPIFILALQEFFKLSSPNVHLLKWYHVLLRDCFRLPVNCGLFHALSL